MRRSGHPCRPVQAGRPAAHKPIVHCADVHRAKQLRQSRLATRRIGAILYYPGSREAVVYHVLRKFLERRADDGSLASAAQFLYRRPSGAPFRPTSTATGP